MLFGLTLTLVPPLNSQVECASVVGNINDKSGTAMAGVAITVTNESTNTSTRVQSDDAGAYTAVNLIPGIYSIGASRRGFRPVLFRNVVLQVGQSARMAITMDVGSID
jgi:hypothetical protein